MMKKINTMKVHCWTCIFVCASSTRGDRPLVMTTFQIVIGRESRLIMSATKSQEGW